MPVELEVQGVGTFEFPNGTTEKQLQSFVQNDLPSFLAQEYSTDKPTQDSGLLTTFQAGFENATQAFEINKIIAAQETGVPLSFNDKQQIYQNIVDAQGRKNALPLPEAVMEFFNPDVQGWDAAEVFASNPLTITSHIIAMSLGTFVPALATGAAGSAVGSIVPGPGTIIGGATGIGIGSAATEMGATFLEALQEEGVDINSTSSINAAMENEDLYNRALERGIKKGIPVGVLDAISAGFAGKFLRTMGTETLGKFAGATATEMGFQAAAGAGGEALGSQLATGQIEGKEVFAEALGEVGTGIVEVPAGYYFREGKAPPSPGLGEGVPPAAEPGKPPSAEEKSAEDLLKEAQDLAATVTEGPGTEREKKVRLQKEMNKRKVPAEISEKLYDEQTTKEKESPAVSPEDQKAAVTGALDTLVKGGFLSEASADVTKDSLNTMTEAELAGWYKWASEEVTKTPATKAKKPSSRSPARPKAEPTKDFLEIEDEGKTFISEIQTLNGKTRLAVIRTADGHTLKKNSQRYKTLRDKTKTRMGEIIKEAKKTRKKATPKTRPKRKTPQGKLTEPKAPEGFLTSKMYRGHLGQLYAAFPNENIRDLFELPAKMRVAVHQNDEAALNAVQATENRIADVLGIESQEVMKIAERYRKNVQETMRNRKPGKTHKAPLPRSTHMRGTDANFEDILPSIRGKDFREIEETHNLTDEEYLDAVKEMLGDEFKRLTGRDVETVFMTPEQSREEYKKLTGKELAEDEAWDGFYNNITNVLGYTLDPKKDWGLYQNNVAHEAHHYVQNWLYTPEDWKLIENNLDRLREIATEAAARKGHQVLLPQHYAPNKLVPEVAAAVAGYYNQEAQETEGKPGSAKPVREALADMKGVLPLFQKVVNFFRRLKNYLNGMGFRTLEDFFEAYHTGEFAKRPAASEPMLKAFMDGQRTNAASITSPVAATLEMDVTTGAIDLKKFFAGQPDRAELFNKWYTGSKVTMPDGSPRVVFHGTTAHIEGFGSFDINKSKDLGFHFGTYDQAIEMADTKGRDIRSVEEVSGADTMRGPWVMPVFINPKKLLRMPDLGVFDSASILDDLYINGIISQTEFDHAKKLILAHSIRNKKSDLLVRNLIKKRGYDGIVYKNTGEGVGARNPKYADDSYIVFDPTNIKSVFAESFSPNDAYLNASIIKKARRSIPKDPEVNRMQDLAAWRQWLTTARDIGTRFPGFAPVFNLMRWRDEARMTYMNNASEEAATGKARIRALMEADEETRNRVAGMAEFARRLDIKNVPKNDEGFYHFTGAQTSALTGTILTPGEPHTLTAQEGKLLEQAREGTNYLLDQIIDGFKHRNSLASDVTSQVLRDTVKALNAIADVTDDPVILKQLNDKIVNYKDLAEKLSNFEDLQGSDYFPMVRPGDKGLTVKRRDPVSGDIIKEPVWFEVLDTTGFNKPTATRRLTEARARLREQFPESEGYLISAPFNLNYDEIRKKFGGGEIFTIDMIASVLNDETKGNYAELRDKIIHDIIDRKGFAAHLQRARKIPGYSHDVKRTYGMYIAAASSYAANSKFSKDMVDALDAIPFEDQRGLKRYAEEFINYNTSPQEEMTFFRNLGFFWYLGFNVSSAILQWATLPIVTSPFLAQFVGTGKAYASTSRAFTNVIRSGIGELSFSPKSQIDISHLKLPPHIDKGAVVRAWNANILKPALGLEQQGFDPISVHVMPPRAERAWRKAIDTSGIFFNTAESIGRMSAFISVLDLAAKDPNFMDKVNSVLADNELWQHQRRVGKDSVEDFAALVIDDSFGTYGKINRTKFMRGFGAAIFQFQSYPQQMIELAARMAFRQGPQGKKAFMLMMGALVFAGGLQGLPGAEDLKEIAEAAYKGVFHDDLDFDTEFREMVTEATDSKAVAEMMSRGVFRSLGLDVSRRAGLGNLPAMDMIKVAFGARSDPSDALGVPGSLTWGAFQDFNERRLVYGSERAAAESFLPTFMKNIYQAYTWNTEGVRNKAGIELLKPSDVSNVDPENFDTVEALLKSTGFSTTDLARVRERMFAQSRLERAIQPKQSAYYKRLAHAIIDAGRSSDKGAARQQIQDIWQEIHEHNKDAPTEDRVIIDPSYLRRLIRRIRLGAAPVPPEYSKKARRRAREIAEVY